MPPHAGSILVDYYEALLRDGNVADFRRNVAARFGEATLARILAESGDPPTRRAAVLSLGLFGTFERSNAVIARALRDPDPTVRELARDSAWSLWYRGGTPEQNDRLDEVRNLIERGRVDEAIERAGRLVLDAPTFAEAYNQRAIAHFLRGNHEASASDCYLVLKHNPHHFGALSGLGQCLLHLRRRDEALHAFRRASELQPFDAGLKALIADLEAER